MVPIIGLRRTATHPTDPIIVNTKVWVSRTMLVSGSKNSLSSNESRCALQLVIALERRKRIHRDAHSDSGLSIFRENMRIQSLRID